MSFLGALALTPVACGQSFTTAAATDAGPEADAPDGRGGQDAHEGGGLEGASPEGGRRDSGGRRDGGPCVDAGDFMSDPENCGACGHVCVGGPCSSGTCPVETFAANLTNPDGLAIDIVSGTVFFTVEGTCVGTGDAQSCAGAVYRNSTSEAVGGTVTTRSRGLPVVVSAANAFWASSMMNGAIQASTLAGKNVVTITPSSATDVAWVALAIDDTNVYAAESGGTIYGTTSASASPSGWMSPGAGGDTLSGIAAAHVGGSHYVFWVDTGSSGKGMLGGYEGTTGLGPYMLDAPSSVAVTALGPIVTDPGDGEILGAPLSLASAPITVDAESPGLLPQRIVTDPATGDVYWTNYGSVASEGNVIALRSGESVPFVLATNQTNPSSIAVDATHVYWVNRGAFNTGDGSIAATTR